MLRSPGGLVRVAKKGKPHQFLEEESLVLGEEAIPPPTMAQAPAFSPFPYRVCRSFRRAYGGPLTPRTKHLVTPNPAVCCFLLVDKNCLQFARKRNRTKLGRGVQKLHCPFVGALMARSAIVSRENDASRPNGSGVAANDRYLLVHC